jgi:hypothetical protein
MILEIYTLIHVLISLIGLFAGYVVLIGLIAGNRLDGWTALFLVSTVATSVTGFFFPVHRFMPSHAVGILSLIMLALTIYARYKRRLAGAWRKTYVIGAVVSLYLNTFVAVVQAFMKIPALKALAPTQSEPPFKLAQLALLAAFVALGIIAALKFRDEPHVAHGMPSLA